MIDYPGKLASVIFLGRCNFRCGFCHNADLVLRPEEIPKFDVDSIFKYLEKKKEWVEGICVTGGEPTLQKGLPELLKKLKARKLAIKLDTNGTTPKILKKLIDDGLVDYVAMDIKTSKEKYEEATGVKVNLENIQESIDLIKSSGLEYEFRTTAVPSLVTVKEVEAISKWLGKDTKKYVIQQFFPVKVIDEKYYNEKPYLTPEIEELVEVAKKIISNVESR